MARTVKPPERYDAVSSRPYLVYTSRGSPKMAHSPTSTTTIRFPICPSLSPPRMIAEAPYTMEKITNGRCVNACINASAVRGGTPSDDGEERTTVDAPITANVIPRRSRYCHI